MVFDWEFEYGGNKNLMSHFLSKLYKIGIVLTDKTITYEYNSISGSFDEEELIEHGYEEITLKRLLREKKLKRILNKLCQVL